MRHERVYTDYLRDMLTYAQQAQAFVQGMTFERFAADARTQAAVLWSLSPRRGINPPAMSETPLKRAVPCAMSRLEFSAVGFILRLPAPHHTPTTRLPVTTAVDGIMPRVFIHRCPALGSA